MNNDIGEGYDMPSDLKHDSNPLWGLSILHFVFLVIGVCAVGIWTKLIYVVGLNYTSNIFVAGLIIIIAVVGCLVLFELDILLYNGFKYVTRPYRYSSQETECKNFSGIYGIESNFVYSRYGDICSILKLDAINSNRVDPDKVDIVEAMDKTFLNALPCEIQIVGYSTDYNLDTYYKYMLKYAQRLPSRTKTLLLAHLDFYREYCDELELNEKNIYMIIKVSSGTARPNDELDLRTKIILSNLISCGVAGTRLTETDLANMIIMLTTGIGKEGIDYLNLYTDVE